MEFIPDKISWRCNACGEKFDTPDRCKCCSSSLCPACKRAGSLVNVKEMQRMVSHAVTLRSEEKKKKPKTSKPKKVKNPAGRIAELMELTRES